MQEKSGEESHGDPPRRLAGEAFGGPLAGVALAAAAVLLAVLWALAPRVAGLLLNSAAVAAPAALLSSAIGAPVAMLIAKTNAPARGMAGALVASLMLLPLHVTASAWMAALGDQGGAPSLLGGAGPTGGWLSGRLGAVFLHGVAGAPWAVLLSAAALRSVDRRREEQALLEASPGRVVWRVTLREAAPSLVAACVLIAVIAAGEMTATDLLRVRTFAEEVYTQAAAGQLLGPDTTGGLFHLGLGVAALGFTAAAAVLTLLGRLAPMTAEGGVAPWRVELSRPRLAAFVLLGVLTLLVGVPVVALAQRAGVVIEPSDGGVRRTWSAAKLAGAVAAAPWQHRRELAASLALAASVATTATAAAAALAWWMRGSRWVAGLACLVLTLALAIPGPVIGLVVIRVLNQPLDSPFAWMGDLYGTWFAPWLAQMVRITPAVALLLWPVALGVPGTLLDAARSDGAGPLTRWARIAAPLMGPALAAAWLVAFALSLGELSATVLVVPPGTPPLSVRLLSLLHYGVEDRVAAICLVLMGAYAALALAVARLLPPRRGVG